MHVHTTGVLCAVQGIRMLLGVSFDKLTTCIAKQAGPPYLPSTKIDIMYSPHNINSPQHKLTHFYNTCLRNAFINFTFYPFVMSTLHIALIVIMCILHTCIQELQTLYTETERKTVLYLYP